jgi:hypothetical protein
MQQRICSEEKGIKTNTTQREVRKGKRREDCIPLKKREYPVWKRDTSFQARADRNNDKQRNSEKTELYFRISASTPLHKINTSESVKQFLVTWLFRFCLA